MFPKNEPTDIDDPIQPQVAGGPVTEPSPEQIGMLADMGFTAAQGKKALRETVCGFCCVCWDEF